ncbi:hypothetical protein [Tolumonas lignilytica]|uniref:hypothetical protein n=1 Tax=Tolumonas lignilytica TaxID=1283284 RepID=UPI00046345B9|nr:hypothetical protein [Tolumonas lignilytica]
MKNLCAAAAIFTIILSGCAAKHEMPTGNMPFTGDKTLSLSSNMELLAGNSSTNRDEDATKADMSAAAATTNAAIIAGKTSVDAMATGALTVGNLAFGVANLMLLGQDNYKHPDYGYLVLMKIDPSDDPASQASLEKAFKYATKQDAARLNGATFIMDNGELAVSDKDKSVAKVKFSTLVSQELINRIDPSLPTGKYAAYGIGLPSFSSGHLKLEEMSSAPWVYCDGWVHPFAGFADTHESITRRVDSKTGKTVVVKYKKVGMNAKQPVNKPVAVQLR